MYICLIYFYVFLFIQQETHGSVRTISGRYVGSSVAVKELANRDVQSRKTENAV